jgi:hypothetical protein
LSSPVFPVSWWRAAVVLADQAVLQGDGAVRIDVTVTCPMSVVGQGGQVTIYDGQVMGRGNFGPTPCDTRPHTVSVRVASSAGSFRVGTAEPRPPPLSRREATCSPNAERRPPDHQIVQAEGNREIWLEAAETLVSWDNLSDRLVLCEGG